MKHVLSRFLVSCADCGQLEVLDNWTLARVIPENQNGQNLYNYVYICEFNCPCGLKWQVEAQGRELPEEYLVKDWHYRFFDCNMECEIAPEPIQ